jgi:polyvinyl alcohol dehydrogenase (cytochrome)
MRLSTVVLVALGAAALSAQPVLADRWYSDPGATTAAATGAATSGETEHGTSRPCDRERPLPGGDWSAYGHDPYNTRTQPAETSIGTANAASLAPAWVFSLSSAGESGQFNSTPVVTDGCVFLTESGGGIDAVDPSSGALVWKHDVTVGNPGLGGAIVGGVAVAEGRVYALVNESGDGAAAGPYVLALDEHTGHQLWQSKPLSIGSGYYTNATPQVIGDVVFAGYSPPEGDSTGQGGFALVATDDGHIVRNTPTISPADQAQGFAGGGIWSTPAWDPRSGFAYVGAGNPYSKDREDPHTNAILKVDMRQGSATFGQIVAAYKGNVDQYTQTLQALSQTPVCAASAAAPDPLDDPACGQLDLDFGAAPNLFTVDGHLAVGDLQKSGVYHVADATTMAPVWNTIAGGTCQACNAATAAVNGSDVFAEGTPGGLLNALDRTSGARTWATPVGDGVHYQSISTANGVVYTFDTAGFFDAWDAASGTPLLRRPMAEDVQFPTAALTSGGIAIADHTVFVAAGGGGSSSAPGLPVNGFLIAYRIP